MILSSVNPCAHAIRGILAIPISDRTSWHGYLLVSRVIRRFLFSFFLLVCICIWHGGGLAFGMRHEMISNAYYTDYLVSL